MKSRLSGAAHAFRVRRPGNPGGLPAAGGDVACKPLPGARAKDHRVGIEEAGVRSCPLCAFGVDTPSPGSVSCLYNGEVGPDGLS